MRQVLRLPIKFPGLNEVIAACKGTAGRGARYSRMKRDLSGQVVLFCRAQKIQPVGRCRLEFRWREENRRRDPDNFAAAKKFILDGLVEAGVLSNDGWEEIVGFTDLWDIGTPGVEVVIDAITPPLG